jgi:hypothetical protein
MGGRNNKNFQTDVKTIPPFVFLEKQDFIQVKKFCFELNENAFIYYIKEFNGII